MENDGLSIEELAKEVNLSPAVIRGLCTGEQKDLKLSNFLQVAKACGYRLILEKGEERISLVL